MTDGIDFSGHAGVPLRRGRRIGHVCPAKRKRCMAITPDDAELITPDRAEEMLKHNAVKRRLREVTVTKYAEIMRRGEWKLNGDTIGFDVDEELTDGQHRLWAVIRSGIPMRTFVITGLDRDVRPTIDAGLSRIFADDLEMLGVTDALNKAALLRKAVLWDRALGLASFGNENVTRSQLMELWPTYEASIEDAAPKKKYSADTPLTTGGVVFTWWLLRKCDSSPEIIEQYFNIIRDGSQAARDKVLVRLNKYLDTPRYNPRSGRQVKVNAKQEIYFMILAWNSWLDEEPVAFRLPTTGLADPYPTPQIATLG
jgi:hypothetical protein